jgi:predicted MFS family arabinose efflux permease
MRVLLGHPLLRAIIVVSVPISFFTAGFLAIYVPYASHELRLSPATIGLVFAAGGVGAISGAMLARRAAERFGVGPAMIGGWILAAAGTLLVPLAAGPTVVVVVILALSRAFEGITDTVANIHQWSLRQIVTPDHLSGRVTAGHRSAVGLRRALLICAVGALLSPLPAVFSPLRRLREQPAAGSLGPAPS